MITVHTVHPDGTVVVTTVDEPAVAVVRTPREILSDLTEAEYATIAAATTTSPTAARWWDMLRAGPSRSDDQRTIEGCQLAVSLGLLTRERCFALFAVTLD